MYRPEDIGGKELVRCGFRDCHQCCMSTEMIITEDEASIIEKKVGVDRKEFLLPFSDVDGFLQLRNVDTKLGNHCFFLSEKGKCTIYDVAPRGCTMYPLILNLETDEAIIDVDCREQTWFRKQEYLESQVITIKELVSTLLLENENRVHDLSLFRSEKADINSLYFEDEEGANELRDFIKQMQEREDEEV